MTVRSIPISRTEPFARYPLTIGGVPLVLGVRWSQRTSRYYLDIFNQVEEPLLTGVKVVPDQQVLRTAAWRGILPEGTELWFVTLSPDVSPPEFGEFGDGERVELLVFS